MSYFIPGTLVRTFQCKTGETVTLRYPRWEDIDELTRYINELSCEDTYITFSKETVSKEDEMAYLAMCFQMMERGDSVTLFAFVGSTLIGSTDVVRNLNFRTRAKHVGKFGITLAKDFRGLGIGKEASRTVIEEARKKVPGLELLALEVFSENKNAIALYEDLGFKVAGAIPNGLQYQGRRQNDISMYLPL